MMDLKDLYRDVILDHNRNPRNFGPLPAASASADGFNPLCGDRLKLHLRLVDDRIEDIRFEGQGCAISTASASLMTESVKGRTRAEALTVFERVHHLLTDDAAEAGDELGKLAALSGVREFPARVKCASLCWHTLVAALKDDAAPAPPAVSTE
ncbi:MAG: SUF system NifU family Fe-S cluster assembly protein [Gammaproteobacteria bacterium]|nr:SUF system NifU family Fe-S cluster assembly protein [Gammaproteobacteria bacterium]MDE2347219.1 SUF system NifU family Fe-S cluster assembly protein [Gammaproteobacteria bacterium]